MSLVNIAGDVEILRLRVLRPGLGAQQALLLARHRQEHERRVEMVLRHHARELHRDRGARGVVVGAGRVLLAVGGTRRHRIVMAAHDVDAIAALGLRRRAASPPRSRSAWAWARACPFSMRWSSNATCRRPPESAAHWSSCVLIQRRAAPMPRVSDVSSESELRVPNDTSLRMVASMRLAETSATTFEIDGIALCRRRSRNDRHCREYPDDACLHVADFSSSLVAFQAMALDATSMTAATTKWCPGQVQRRTRRDEK